MKFKPPTAEQLHNTDKRARYVRWSVQQECERHTLLEAQRALKAGTAGEFAMALMLAYAQARADDPTHRALELEHDRMSGSQAGGAY